MGSSFCHRWAGCNLSRWFPCYVKMVPLLQSLALVVHNPQKADDLPYECVGVGLSLNGIWNPFKDKKNKKGNPPFKKTNKTEKRKALPTYSINMVPSLEMLFIPATRSLVAQVRKATNMMQTL